MQAIGTRPDTYDMVLHVLPYNVLAMPPPFRFMLRPERVARAVDDVQRQAAMLLYGHF